MFFVSFLFFPFLFDRLGLFFFSSYCTLRYVEHDKEVEAAAAEVPHQKAAEEVEVPAEQS